MKFLDKSTNFPVLEDQDIAHVWLDNLEIYFKDDTCFNFEFDKNLNIDWSPEGETDIWGLHFKYTLWLCPSWYEKVIKFFLYHDYFDENKQEFRTDFFNVFSIFYWKNKPVEVYDWKWKNKKLVWYKERGIKWKNKVVFHSTFFMYEELYIWIKNKKYQFLYNFINKYFNFDFTSQHLHRFDVCVDIVNISKSFLIPYFSDGCFSWHIGKLRNELWFFETDYIGTKSSDKNRNYLIRIYDKIADTRAKKKRSLFWHLNQYDSVIRFEVEFRSEFCKRITSKNEEKYFEEKEYYLITNALDLLINPDIITEFFYIKISQFTRLFNSLHDNSKNFNFKPYDKKEYLLEKEYLKLWHIPEWYLKKFLWYSKRIIELTGYSWYIQAMFWLLIQDHKNIKKKLISEIIKNPINFIDIFLSYIISNVKIDRYKLNKILQKYILPFKQK